MDKYKRILICCLSMLLIFSFTACKDNKVEKEISSEENNETYLTKLREKANAFPTQKNGYPKEKTIIVNGKTYELKKFTYGNLSSVEETIDIELPKNETKLEVTIPQYITTHLWDIDPD